MEPPKSFSPIPVDPVYAAFPDDSRKYDQEQRRTSWSSLIILSDATFNTYVPYGWGFTIYRVRFPGDSDERFQNALRRFESWVRAVVRAARYGNDNLRDLTILPDGADPTDQLADRLYNEVFEFNPAESQQPVISGPEGEEDFSAVGAAFSEWVSSLNVDLDASRGNARYNQCLIIDKTALESLEKLPETLPPLEHFGQQSSHVNELRGLYYFTWVWVLDRKSTEMRTAGEQIAYAPWVRLRINFVRDAWFHAPMGTKPREWPQLAEEDKDKWETVAWWNPQAYLLNGLRRQTRGRKPFAELLGSS